MERARESESLGELFGDLSRELSRLVRQEVALAKLELSQALGQVGADVACVAIGGAILYAGLLALIFALVLVLDLALHALWLSGLLVAIAVLGIGYGLLQRGLSRLKRVDVTPTRTLATLQGNVDWAKGEGR